MTLDEIIKKFFFYLFFQDPLLGRIGHREERHSGRVTYHKGQDHRTAELSEISSLLELSEQEVRQYDIECMSTKLFNITDELLVKTKRGIFAELSQITDFTGTTRDARGQPFSYDMYLDMLKSMPISFNSEGEPVLPSIVANPMISQTIRNLKPSSKQEEQLQKIIEKKRREYLDKKCGRRLSYIGY